MFGYWFLLIVGRLLIVATWAFASARSYSNEITSTVALGSSFYISILLFSRSEFGMVVPGVSVAAGYRIRQPCSRGFARR